MADTYTPVNPYVWVRDATFEDDRDLAAAAVSGENTQWHSDHTSFADHDASLDTSPYEVLDAGDAATAVRAHGRPIVTALSVATGDDGGGTAVTITGLHFTGATDVHFGTEPATSVVIVSNTSITCVTPAHAAGRGDVTVTTGGKTSDLVTADHFTFTHAS